RKSTRRAPRVIPPATTTARRPTRLQSCIAEERGIHTYSSTRKCEQVVLDECSRGPALTNAARIEEANSVPLAANRADARFLQHRSYRPIALAFFTGFASFSAATCSPSRVAEKRHRASA